MPTARFLPRRFLVVLTALAAPAVAALLLLAIGGFVAAGPALLAAAAIILLLGLLLRSHLRQIEAITAYLKKLAGGTDDAAGAAPLPPASGPIRAAGDLQQAVADAGRLWARRRRDLEALVAANDTVLASLPDPLIMLDRERRIVRANPAAEGLLGPALAGRDLLGALRNPDLTEAVDMALGGQGGKVVEFSLPVPVERSFSARVEPLARPIIDGTAALLTLHDLTQIKRTDQMRADFVANASHEMRTPLSTLLGFIETLRGPARDDAAAQERFLAIMHEQALRMSRLVADLLSLSRIELNEHTAPTRRVVLADVIRGVVDTLQFKAQEKGMTIDTDAAPPQTVDGAQRLDLLPPVIGDEDELAQVFQNLIDNAIKYGRTGSRIRIAGWTVTPAPGIVTAGAPLPARRLDRPAVAVVVMDEGEGIPREHLPRLTERFYRVDAARSRDLGGTGLGLAIVKHILNRHRGALDIDSVQGEGSRFTVYLPTTAGARGAAVE